MSLALINLPSAEQPKSNVILERAGGALLPISSVSIGTLESPRTPGHSSSSSSTSEHHEGHLDNKQGHLLAGRPMEKFEDSSLVNPYKPLLFSPPPLFPSMPPKSL